MRTTVLAAAILIVAPAFAQEIQHAPTAAQCQADQRLWQSQAGEYFQAAKSHDVKNTVVVNLTAIELLARSMEMSDCYKVDSENFKMYSLTQCTYAQFFSERATTFMKRHDLMKQFFDEDAAGAR
jgi:predicted nucleic-acid-binding Zn-ribbon protein